MHGHSSGEPRRSLGRMLVLVLGRIRGRGQMRDADEGGLEIWPQLFLHWQNASGGGWSARLSMQTSHKCFMIFKERIWSVKVVFQAYPADQNKGSPNKWRTISMYLSIRNAPLWDLFVFLDVFHFIFMTILPEYMRLCLCLMHKEIWRVHRVLWN